MVKTVSTRLCDFISVGKIAERVGPGEIQHHPLERQYLGSENDCPRLSGLRPAIVVAVCLLSTVQGSTNLSDNTGSERTHIQVGLPYVVL